MIYSEQFCEILLDTISILANELSEQKDSVFEIKVFYDWNKKEWCVDRDWLWGENPCPYEKEN